MATGAKEYKWGLPFYLKPFNKGTDSFLESDAFGAVNLLKVPTLSVVTLRIKFQHEFWRRHKHSNHSIWHTEYF